MTDADLEILRLCAKAGNILLMGRHPDDKFYRAMTGEVYNPFLNDSASSTPPGPFEPDPYYETTEEWAYVVCPYCNGDGGDPLSDFVLECPHCGGAGCRYPSGPCVAFVDASYGRDESP